MLRFEQYLTEKLIAERGKLAVSTFSSAKLVSSIYSVFSRTHNRYTLTGPSPISDEDVATLLSTHLETSITYIEKPLAFFTKTSAALEAIKASGIEEDNKFMKGDFERLAGRKPETFDDYLMKEDAMAPCEKKALCHTLTMTSKLEKEFPEEKHTLTMMPKIEADFPEEPHFITLVPKTEQ